VLSPRQEAAIAHVMAAYPDLLDSAFVHEHPATWHALTEITESGG